MPGLGGRARREGGYFNEPTACGPPQGGPRAAAALMLAAQTAAALMLAAQTAAALMLGAQTADGIR